MRVWTLFCRWRPPSGPMFRQDAHWHPRVADEDSRMTLEPRHSPIVPSYGTATLADLSSSILASLDPQAPPEQNVLGLAPAQRACLLIVDGLGWELLRAHPAVAPFLSELARNSRPITAGFPATTVTSLGSLWPGRPPRQPRMLGYKALVPGEDIPLHALRWD